MGQPAPCFEMQDPEAGEGTERARSGNVLELIPWEYPCSREVGGEGEHEDAGDTPLSARQDRQETLEERPAEAVPGQPKECIEGPRHGRGPPSLDSTTPQHGPACLLPRGRISGVRVGRLGKGPELYSRIESCLCHLPFGCLGSSPGKWGNASFPDRLSWDVCL